MTVYRFNQIYTSIKRRSLQQFNKPIIDHSRSQQYLFLKSKFSWFIDVLLYISWLYHPLFIRYSWVQPGQQVVKAVNNHRISKRLIVYPRLLPCNPLAKWNHYITLHDHHDNGTVLVMLHNHIHFLHNITFHYISHYITIHKHNHHDSQGKNQVYHHDSIPSPSCLCCSTGAQEKAGKWQVPIPKVKAMTEERGGTPRASGLTSSETRKPTSAYFRNGIHGIFFMFFSYPYGSKYLLRKCLGYDLL